MHLTVRAIYGTTSKYFAVRATTPVKAIAKVGKRELKGATAFVVYVPKMGANATMPIYVAKA